MRRFLLAVSTTLLVVYGATAEAGPFGIGKAVGLRFSAHGPHGHGFFGFELGKHHFDPNDYDPNSYDPNACDPNGTGHHFFDHEDGWGRFEFGFFGAEWHGGWGHFWGVDPQQRVEDKFADLMDTYEMDMQNIEDYFNSDEYQQVIDDLESLIDKDEKLLSRIESKIESVSKSIDSLEEKLSSLEDNWDPNDLSEMSEKCQEWIERLHELKVDMVSGLIDKLTEKQSSLEDSLDENTMLNDDLNAYLEEIINAGGTPAVTESATLSASDVTTPPLITQSVPEPGALGLALLGLLGSGLVRRKN